MKVKNFNLQVIMICVDNEIALIGDIANKHGKVSDYKDWQDVVRCPEELVEKMLDYLDSNTLVLKKAVSKAVRKQQAHCSPGTRISLYKLCGLDYLYLKDLDMEVAKMQFAGDEYSDNPIGGKGYFIITKFK